MAKKVPLDKLAESIEKLLNEYEEDVIKDTGKLAKDFAKKGAQTLRQESRAKGWGDSTDYDTGWSSTYEEGRLSQQGIIYNKTVPGLPHLLEKSHALRGGGRSNAYPHIAPVEEKISEEFYKAVTKAL